MLGVAYYPLESVTTSDAPLSWMDELLLPDTGPEPLNQYLSTTAKVHKEV